MAAPAVRTPGTAPVVDRADGSAEWRALGTHVVLRTHPDVVVHATSRAVEILDEVDRTCSRFRPDSDLARVNAEPGRAVEVSALLVGAVMVALEAADETDGLVDPLLGEVLVGAGYDRTFDLVPADDRDPAALPHSRPDWRAIEVTPTTVCIPARGLDVGATGKAFAADLVALALSTEFGVPVLAGIGGDLRAEGELAAYPVVAAHTRDDLAAGDGFARILLSRGGIATSSTRARRWLRGSRAWHHVIDPSTGRPTMGPWATVTAWGHTATAANVATTAALVLGERAVDWLESRGVAAVLVSHDDQVIRTSAWAESGLEVSDE